MRQDLELEGNVWVKQLRRRIYLLLMSEICPREFSFATLRLSSGTTKYANLNIRSRKSRSGSSSRTIMLAIIVF